MRHFTGADAEGKRAERAMCSRVAVAADDGHARLGQAQFGCHHMHDAAIRVVEIKQFDGVALAVAAQGVDLEPGLLVGEPWCRAAFAWDGRSRVIKRRAGAFGPTHAKAARIEFRKGLWRGDFVDQVQVDVEQRGRVIAFGDNGMRVPQFVEQGSWCVACGIHAFLRR